MSQQPPAVWLERRARMSWQGDGEPSDDYIVGFAIGWRKCITYRKFMNSIPTPDPELIHNQLYEEDDTK